MNDCGCHAEARNAAERRVLWIALGLNAAMALIGGIAGCVAQQIGLAAIGSATKFKANAAMLSGSVLLLLGLGVLVEVGRRALFGSEPGSSWMVGVALLSLVVNMTVLRMLTPLRSGDVHLRVSWIFTRADVVANVSVVLSGVLVGLT